MTYRLTIAAVGVVVAMSVCGAFGDAPQNAPEIRRVPQFENGSVTVWKSILPPGAQSTLHRHDHGRTVIGIVGGDLKTVKASGEVVVNRFEAGQAYWMPPDPAGETHRDLNDSAGSIEVMVVEMK